MKMRVENFKKFLSELSFPTKVMLICAVISGSLLSLSIVSGDLGVTANAVFLTVFIVAVPQFMIRYERFKTIREMEAKFPIFLRNMIESVRSGMPFHQALVLSSNVDYGKLSKEVKKMANQITWGMPFEKVIDQFAKRSKESKRLNIALGTIRESYLTGGDVVSTLESVSETTTILDEAEKEKRSLMSQYVILMYGISILFLGVVVGINKLMIPIFENMNLTGGAAILTDPCGTSNNVFCGLFGYTCSMFKIMPGMIACYYTSLFFYMAMVQAICSGLVAGQISENSVIAGLKHSIILVAIAFGAFTLLVRFGMLG
jgi:flagellar protein FlaJ